MESIAFDCPGCRQPLSAKSQHAGASIRCPKCSASVKIPGAAAIEVAPILAPAVHTQSPTVIVKSRGEGCFLQTLNAGCFIVALIIVLIVIAVIFISNS